ncbi:LAMI_0F01398g1_1 [Lachancea mirantina]|uniref:LAMI_0F01398g1_1 n=1 Tax=Lachancea mirantina TaxID=1230905 RepID=A0A1G4JVW3_9SACH|nr:LAMI_0F01398g1_1 [Lachancea mirantina]
MSKVNQFLDAITARRTIYSLKPSLPEGLSIEDVQKVVQKIVKETPSAFNSQINRAVILTGQAHKDLWSKVIEGVDGNFAKRPISVRDEAFGTVLFMVNDEKTSELQGQFPAWASAFNQFADHSSGAAQISTWTALELLGLGAHLQHFNGFVKASASDDIVPKHYSVQAQLVFGAPVEAPQPKTYIDNEIKVIS